MFTCIILIQPAPPFSKVQQQAVGVKKLAVAVGRMAQSLRFKVESAPITLVFAQAFYIYRLGRLYFSVFGFFRNGAISAVLETKECSWPFYVALPCPIAVKKASEGPFQYHF